MDLRRALHQELAERRSRNARYSLRAFARDLGTDHATLSQLLRGKRHLTPSMVQRLGPLLGLGKPAIVEAGIGQDARAILRLAGTPGFRTHSRWIAQRTGIPMDAVNIALHWLLRHGHLVMHAPDRWTIRSLPHG